MYQFILATHSLFRWFVLISLVYAIIRACKGWFQNLEFSKADNNVRHITATIAHIQLMLGLWLYFISPIVKYFYSNFNEAVHQRAIRFFGMEHITVMFIAIIVLTIGSAKAKRKSTDKAKFKTIAIWFSIGLFLILTSIPWSFSPLISRPNFRGFF